jgi:prephenate dehydratase/chorismate mutase
MKLPEIRQRIDRIDSQLVKLLNERAELALRTRHLKPHTTDENRERQVLDNVSRLARGLIPAAFISGLFRDLIDVSRRLEESGSRLIGFQGEHGANSEAAARAFDPALVPIPCREFADVFSGVANRSLDLGILPVENSLEGAVTDVNDLLIARDLHIVGETRIPIGYSLLTLPETDYREIRVVYSHPQALAQCRQFIARNRLEARPFYDTAGAARMIAESRLQAAAAIANRSCAEYYDLDILKENIEDEPTNSTRFVVLSAGAGAADGDKCSIVFSTPHEAGALFRILEIFSAASVNLTRIESRPNKADPGKYVFLLDLRGSSGDERVIRALQAVEQRAAMYKFLGCYREA